MVRTNVRSRINVGSNSVRRQLMNIIYNYNQRLLIALYMSLEV